jgi:acetoin utilization deacetylase AcuC-like enzyme
MTVGLFTHDDCHLHHAGEGHPESPQRLDWIRDQLIAERVLELLREYPAPEAGREALERVHSAAFLDQLERRAPAEGLAAIDDDTVMNRHTLRAARHAAGAVVDAVDRVMAGEIDQAFCAVRPPGHHAEPDRAMGFCFNNNVAVGAAHALAVHGLERIAIFDFDAHYGNGTETIFHREPRIQVLSTYEDHLFPAVPPADMPRRFHQVALAPGSDGDAFKDAVRTVLMPALERFRPQLIMVSAGFDGHWKDQQSHLRFREADYEWITLELLDAARRMAGGRLVSSLEGGYSLAALARSVAMHVRTLATG